MMESITIQDVYKELKMIEENMVTREDIMALIDSVEILQNPETMRKIHKSDQDIKTGRVKKINSVKDMLDDRKGNP